MKIIMFFVLVFGLTILNMFCTFVERKLFMFTKDEVILNKFGKTLVHIVCFTLFAGILINQIVMSLNIVETIIYKL